MSLTNSFIFPFLSTLSFSMTFRSHHRVSLTEEGAGLLLVSLRAIHAFHSLMPKLRSIALPHSGMQHTLCTLA